MHFRREVFFAIRSTGAEKMAEGCPPITAKIAIFSTPFPFLPQWSHKGSHDLKLGFVQDKLIGAEEGSGTSALTLIADKSEIA